MTDPNTQRLFNRATEIAAKYKRNMICEDVLLCAFFPVFNLSVAELIRNIGIDELILSSEARGVMEKKRACKNITGKKSRTVLDIIAEAETVAKDEGDPLLPLHIFICLGRHLPQAMKNLNISIDDIVNGYVMFNAGGPVQEQHEINQCDMFHPNSILDEFAINLNLRAQMGEYDGIVDYDNKCGEIITILGKEQKPNPILVGKSGVGKSSLVYALARKIVNGEAPDLLANSTIYSLNLSSLVAGTEYRGQFEARLESFINEIKKYDNIVLFIDEIHTLVGAGGVSGASLEASNILKPDLATGKIKCIGATTIDEYQQFIKKDSALDRRFQKIVVREPSTEEMKSILPTIVSFFGEKHNVKYSDRFLKELLPLCDKKLVNKVYPDKVIDVIDHCGAAKKLEYFHVSPEITQKRLEIYGDVPAAPTEAQNNEFAEFISSMENKLQQTPKVCSTELRDYFEKQSNPMYSFVKKIDFVTSLHQEVLSQKQGINEFVKHVTVNSLGFNNSVGIPDSYSFIGEKGSGKSVLCRALKAGLLKYGANVISLDGKSLSEYDIVSPYSNHKDTVAEQVLIHPQSILIIDDADAITGAKYLIDQILFSGQLTHNGEKVDFSNCQVVLTETVSTTASSIGFVNQGSNISELNSLGQKQIHLQPIEREALKKIVLDDICKLKSTLKEHNVTIEIPAADLDKVIDKAFAAANRGDFIQKLFSNKILPLVAENLQKNNKKMIIKLDQMV